MTSQVLLASDLLFTCQRSARLSAHHPRGTRSELLETTVEGRSRGTQVLSSGTWRPASITWPGQESNLQRPASEAGVSSGCTTGPECVCVFSLPVQTFAHGCAGRNSNNFGKLATTSAGDQGEVPSPLGRGRVTYQVVRYRNPDSVCLIGRSSRCRSYSRR